MEQGTVQPIRGPLVAGFEFQGSSEVRDRFVPFARTAERFGTLTLLNGVVVFLPCLHGAGRVSHAGGVKLLQLLFIGFVGLLGLIPGPGTEARDQQHNCGHDASENAFAADAPVDPRDFFGREFIPTRLWPSSGHGELRAGEAGPRVRKALRSRSTSRRQRRIRLDSCSQWLSWSHERKRASWETSTDFASPSPDVCSSRSRTNWSSNGRAAAGSCDQRQGGGRTRPSRSLGQVPHETQTQRVFGFRRQFAGHDASHGLRDRAGHAAELFVLVEFDQLVTGALPEEFLQREGQQGSASPWGRLA